MLKYLASLFLWLLESVKKGEFGDLVVDEQKRMNKGYVGASMPF
jgi:hypothetical protein